MLTETFLRYGQSGPPAELIPLRAGPLTMLYDPASGMVRRIKRGEVEVVRGIYAAVRDHNWGTLPGTIRELVRNVEPRSFQIEFESEHQQGSIHFIWRGSVRGNADGTVRYEFAGEAKTTFLRNRIGCCVLHPIQECAGARARQFRNDGTEVDCRFPDLIEPQIFGRGSFRELRGLAHEVAPDLWAEVHFEGDTFEMEDQRNWTDASFKTYCTPLTVPFPVEVKFGDSIRQTVTLKLVGAAARFYPAPVEVSSEGSELIRLIVPQTPTCRLPAIGLGISSHAEPLRETEIISLQRLGLSHLRVDVRLASPEAIATLSRATCDAVRLNVTLELTLYLPRAGEANPGEVLRFLNQQAPPLRRILALREGEPATSPETLTWVRKYFGLLGVPIGAGSDCNFCEVNREHALGRLALAHSDFVFWSVNPQVHAFDHLSIMETLEAQTATIASARAFAGARPFVISPITLKPRFNPVATSAVEITVPGELPAQVDPRQLSHFAAAWTLGSIAALTAAGVDSVTYYETVGWRGVIEHAVGSSRPEKFPAHPGAPFPVFHMLAQLAGFDQAAFTTNSPSRNIALLGLFSGQRLGRVVVANLLDDSSTVMLEWPTGSCSPLELKPYEVAWRDPQT